MHGVVLDATNPAGRPWPTSLAALGADFGRLVAFEDVAFYSYHATLAYGAVATAVVLASESFKTGDIAGDTTRYAQAVKPSVYVIGNEEDAWLLPEPSPSSWAMPPAEYAELWQQASAAILAAQPDAALCLGGLVAGSVEVVADYLAAIQATGAQLPRYVDVHPYGKTADEARELIRAIRDSYGLVPLVLEWNRPAAEIPNYVAMLRQETAASSWFAWSDGMVPPMGLVDVSANEKAEYLALQGVLGSRS